MILTVTPNPALDLTITTEALELGESNRVPTALARAGGKGVNVARVLHQVGEDALVLATAGGTTGEELERELRAAGLPARLLPVAGATRRSFALVERGSGRTTVLNERGAALDAHEVDGLLALASELMPGAAALVVAGSLPPGLPPDVPARLVGIARRHQVPSLVDASGEALLAAARARATLLKPNRRELAESVHLDDPEAGARRLLELGARRVVVSLGEDGLLLVSATEPAARRARLPAPLKGNPTGAGDAVVAALASLLAVGAVDPAALLRRAVAWSAAAVLAPQAGELSPAYADLVADVVLEPA